MTPLLVIEGMAAFKSTLLEIKGAIKVASISFAKEKLIERGSIFFVMAEIVVLRSSIFEFGGMLELWSTLRAMKAFFFVVVEIIDM